MHAGGGRKNGGIGFSVSEPSSTLEITASEQFQFNDLRETPFAKTEIRQIANAIEASVEAFDLDSNICVTLNGELMTHVGLGSGTAVRLGVLEGLFFINGKSISENGLVRQSKRGGTSGIGINTYFSGGLVFDLGIANDCRGFAPSSQTDSKHLPSLIPSLPMPPWPVCICIPRFIRPKTQEEEVDFFNKAAPVKPADSYEASYHALFGVYAAVIEHDFSAFCCAIDAIQATTWKKQEWFEYGDSLLNLAKNLRDQGADAIGMSSIGPMLFCLGNEDSMTYISQQGGALNCDVIRTVPDNSGRTVISG